ncbi:MAG TPA: hypothetical protein VJ741_05755 [Solirubrobacteraceae bacterium]|nr:hypothetical protein [Solirubrobacteraceae bacterium]
MKWVAGSVVLLAGAIVAAALILAHRHDHHCGRSYYNSCGYYGKHG